MAIIRPFKAIRPVKELVDKIAALPYDVMDSDEAREMVKDNPYSFLHVDRAEIDLPEDINMYDTEVYKKAKKNFANKVPSSQSCVFFSLVIYGSKKAMATHSSTLAWKISWTEEPGRLQSMGS